MGSRVHQVSELPQKVLQAATGVGLEGYLLSEALVVGVSGGADSLALLHILCELRGSAAKDILHVAHLDHGFRGEEGAQDARFVGRIARQLGLACTMEGFDVPAYARSYKLSAEEAARKARYAFLGALAEQHKATVAVAHTADDQVETVLMNLLRGSGVSGLAGMAMLGQVHFPRDDQALVALVGAAQTTEIAVFRPLLATWRTEIDGYCAELGLQPRLDATNADPTYTRNRIRHQLLPLLEREYNPAVKQRLLHLSELLMGEDRLVESLAEEEAVRLAEIEKDGSAIRFDQQPMRALPEALRRRVVRRAIKEMAGTLEGFTYHHITKASDIVAGIAGSPRSADLPHGLVVAREDGASFVSRRLSAPGAQLDTLPGATRWPVIESGREYAVTPGEALELRCGWALRSALIEARDKEDSAGNLCAFFDADLLNTLESLTLRTRQPGDFIRPLGMLGRKSLQDLFVDAKIPKRLRDFIPIIGLAGREEVLWVPGPGGRRSLHAPIGTNTRRVLRLEFIRRGEDSDGTTAP